MGVLQRQRWFVLAAAVTLAYGAVSWFARPVVALTTFADCLWFFMVLGAAAAFAANARSRPKPEFRFWGLLTLAFLMWSFNQGMWVYREALLHRSMPDPYFNDIVLFLHFVPLFAAVASRPHHVDTKSQAPVSTLHFLMLLMWWVFLYAFIVLPHQYVVLNVKAYNRYYDQLYQAENILLLLLLAFAVWTSSENWRRLYLHLFGAEVLYTLGSGALAKAVSAGIYYSGSLYDVPTFAAVMWTAAIALSARNWELTTQPAPPDWERRQFAPRVAMFAILSLPLFGLWTFALDQSPYPSRVFRLFTVLIAMLVMGTFVFLRQYIQDQKLLNLLKESRQGFENEQRLQTHLVQKEKLASLGNLVAGAAHEINDPIDQILQNAESLWTHESLTPTQNDLVRKISLQARRTSDLVSGLLSFAQQAPKEKALLDVGVLLQRSVQVLKPEQRDGRIQIALTLEPGLPRILANATQLLQSFVEMMQNSRDALEEVTRGVLQITAEKQGNDVVIRFADNGPGLREPQRVFDPFYTTKPIGKGTGLGLSVVYGVVQDHGGQISCQNQPSGGALFVMRFPIAVEPVAQTAMAAKVN